MNYKQANLRFLIRTSKKRKNGEVPIYFRITVDEKRAEMSTGRTIKPARWDPKSQQVKGSKPDAQSINRNLELLKTQAYQARQELITEGSEVTAKAIKAKLKGEDKVKKPLLEVFKKHNKKMESLTGKGKDYSYSTLKKYKTTIKHVRKFLNEEKGNKNYLISKVDTEFLEEFEHFLKTKKDSCSHNTTMRYQAHLKKIINKALRKGWMKDDPFEGYKHKYEKEDPVFLTQDELDRLQNKDLDIDRLDRVRDIFVFSCYTGLGYSDAEKLKQSDIKTDNQGKKYLSIPRKKTTQISRIQLLKPALEIINKYRDDPETSDGSLLPMISNQKTNAYLKEIATLCKIDKKLTHHVARHTCATTVLLENGVGVETVQMILGHSQLQTTLHYARVTQSKVGKEMTKLDNKLAS